MAAVVVGKPLSIWRMRVVLSRLMRETSGRLGSNALFQPQPSIRIRMMFLVVAVALPPSSSSGKRGRAVLPVNRYSNVPGRLRNDAVWDGGAYFGLAIAISGGIPLL